MSQLGREPPTPAPQASTLPKELSRQLIAGYSEPLLDLRAAQHPASTPLFFSIAYLSLDAGEIRGTVHALGGSRSDSSNHRQVSVRVFMVKIADTDHLKSKGYWSDLHN
jgi:hypothetical protein